jgi:hypothetical protein
MDMDHGAVKTFVDHWVAAWNAHDLDAILAHFTDDIVFASPMAAALFPDSHGTLHGKQAVREYWAEGLRRIPNLHFEVLGHYLGVGVLVIHYRNQDGRLVNEVLMLGDDGLVTAGYGTYQAD